MSLFVCCSCLRKSYTRMHYDMCSINVLLPTKEMLYVHSHWNIIFMMSLAESHVLFKPNEDGVWSRKMRLKGKVWITVCIRLRLLDMVTSKLFMSRRKGLWGKIKFWSIAEPIGKGTERALSMYTVLPQTDIIWDEHITPSHKKRVEPLRR